MASEFLCFEVFRKTHELNPTPGEKRAEWLTSREMKLSLAFFLLLFSIGFHFWCCDWDSTQLTNWSLFRERIDGGYDNQLIGPIHAGSPFRGPAIDGALYNLGAAAWYGLYLPMLLVFIAAMLAISEYAPGPYERLIRRPIQFVLARSSRRLCLSAPAFVVIMIMTLGTTAAVGSVCVSELGTTTFVEKAKDSYVALSQADGQRSPTSSLSYSNSASFSPWSSSPSVVTVPEPGTITLLATALASLAFYRWRRRST